MDILSVQTWLNNIEINIIKLLVIFKCRNVLISPLCTSLDQNNMKVPLNSETFGQGGFSALTDFTLSRISRMTVLY